MYKIIGADQVEYGPISLEQMRQWIAEGRVNAQTPAKAEGDTEWKPIASFPEFAANVARTPAPPPLGGAAAAVGADSRAKALQKVSGPAIALMITASLGMLYGVFAVVMNLIGASIGNFQPAGQNPELDRMMTMSHGAIGIFTAVLGLVLWGVVLFGAIKMKKLESFGLCVAASIIAMLPCSCCCLLGIGFGIWALVVLNQADVKANFT